MPDSVFPPDILSRIKREYEDHYLLILDLFLHELEDLEVEFARIIRSVMYLADGDYGRLKEVVEHAAYDHRDILYWAEYDVEDRKIRDAAQPFEE